MKIKPILITCSLAISFVLSATSASAQFNPDRIPEVRPERYVVPGSCRDLVRPLFDPARIDGSWNVNFVRLADRKWISHSHRFSGDSTGPDGRVSNNFLAPFGEKFPSDRNGRIDNSVILVNKNGSASMRLDSWGGGSSAFTEQKCFRGPDGSIVIQGVTSGSNRRNYITIQIFDWFKNLNIQ